MKFEIHKRFRFDCNYNEDDYNTAFKKYINHLSQIRFKKTPDLLTYFGLSFFHDGLIKSININPQNLEILLQISREDDKTDIDYFRRNHSLPEIRWSSYEKNPILYECKFSGVSTFKIDVDDLKNIFIIDSEIDYNNGKYLVSLSLSDIRDILISCDSVKVDLINKELISKYTNNLTSVMPYCESCKKKLIVENELVKMGKKR